MLQLKDTGLFRQRCYIDGKWTAGDTKDEFDVINPSNGAKLGVMTGIGEIGVKQAVDAAENASNIWRHMTARQRSNRLMLWHKLIMENQDDLAAVMTAEQGKPLAESKGEIAYSASFVEWFAEEAVRIYGDVIPSHERESRLIVLKEPVGVCAAITPWNFPSAMITRKAAPALAAGCSIIVKPASQTPFSATALAELSRRAGIPEGVFNVICGDSEKIGNALTQNEKVRKFSFTGSTETGRKLMEKCAGSIKKISLELGGNAPFIVFDDADIDAAVAGTMASKYRNTGQTCVCANRILVQNGVYDEFSKKLLNAVQSLVVGDGFEENVTQGPLIDMNAVRKVESHIADAQSKGAKILTGGRRHSLGGTFFEPTVLADTTSDMKIFSEETFGPIAPLFRFDTEKEAVKMANDTQYGLASYFYSKDSARIWRVSEGLEYGMVGINTGIISAAAAPFGGMKQSGIGREGSKYGIDEYLEIKYLCMGNVYG